MDSYLTLKFALKNETNVIKKIAAPDVSNKKVIDEEILRKRKLRFAADTLSDCKVLPSKKDTSDVLVKRQLRFNEDVPKASKPNEDILNTLKRRKERFGEITSTLLKSIEEKERVLKRKVRFGQDNEGMKQNDEKVKKLKTEQICENACEISTTEQVKGKKLLKKITFEDSDFSLSEDNLLNGS